MIDGIVAQHPVLGAVPSVTFFARYCLDPMNSPFQKFVPQHKATQKSPEMLGAGRIRAVVVQLPRKEPDQVVATTDIVRRSSWDPNMALSRAPT